jgi:hypothetical protein
MRLTPAAENAADCAGRLASPRRMHPNAGSEPFIFREGAVE